MTNDKRSIRKQIRGLKKQFTDEELVEMSRPIISELLAHQAVNGAKTILMYYSLPDEVFTHDAINLLESGLDQICDRIVAVTSPLELRVRRIMARDGISEQYARLRISAQQPDEYYRGKCGCELNNDADTAEEFEAEARDFFRRLTETIKEEKAHGKA